MRQGPPPPRGPIERILGVHGTERGPRALLGLEDGVPSEAAVRAAFESRVRQLEAHPEGATPAGDEVRLALHTAAAQLLDPGVRRQISQRDLAASIGQAVGRPREPRPDPHDNGTLREVESEALIAIALHGGWNRRALRHLVIVAHQRGFSSRQIAAGLLRMAKPKPRVPRCRDHPDRAGRAALGAVGTPAPAVAASVGDGLGADPVRRVIFLLGGVMAVLVLLIALAVTVLSGGAPGGGGAAAPPIASSGQAASPGTDTPPASQTGAPADDTGLFRPPAVVTDPDEPARNPADARVAAQMLADATDALTFDVDAAMLDFEAAYAAIAANWCSFAPDQSRALRSAMIEFVYRASAAGLGEPALRVIRAPVTAALSVGDAEVASDEIWPIVWSSGMTSRLSRERDLPAQVKRALTRASSEIGEVSSPTFEQGGGNALAYLAPRLVGDAAGSPGMPLRRTRAQWERWVAAASAVGQGNPTVIDALVLNAADMLLAIPADADLSPHARAAIRVLVPELDWRDRAAARSWLLRLLGDPSISTDALNAVTEALAIDSAAAGVDVTMVLSSNATGLARRDLRARYAEAWSMPDAGTDEATAQRLAVAYAALDSVPPPESPVERLTLAVRHARLNAAATMLWDGRGAEAGALLDGGFDDIDRALAAQQPGQAAAPMGDQPGTWAEQYAASRADPTRRIELLERVPRGRPLSPVDAEVLVEEAFRGSPRAVRDAASDAVLSLSDRPAIVNALLEELPRAPRSRHVARLIEFCSLATLPDTRDPDWRLASHRALVERLLQLIAAEGPFAAIDRLSSLLGDAYRDAAGQALSSASLDLPGTARFLSGRWAAAADGDPLAPFTAEGIARRRAARAAVAEGVIQRFLVEQAALAESLAAAVGREQPDQRAAIIEVVRTMDDERRLSADAFAQLAVTERAIGRLWMLRHRAGGAS